mmetsp:Transcript_291/g.574  ORF Transcript_291/g.574 Transcript_291/m.574 type:complete len:300 (+) Transcript_291:80-979(+)
MRYVGKSFPNCQTAIFHIIIVCLAILQSFPIASAVVYTGGSHSVESSLDDVIILRSSSKLTLPSGDYTIRSPSGGSDGAAILLTMSSVLNATGGDVIGGDATKDHPASAGVVVGSASRASFYEGVTVRGGNHLGRAGAGHEEMLSATNFYEDVNNGEGGDALISQYFGSNVTIHGGNFMGGQGSVQNGHSLRASYEAEIHVFGGTFYGSWLARDHGSIIVNGCLSRIGSRLVGRLQNGHSLDIQVIEDGEGTVILKTPETCNHYRKSDSDSDSSAARCIGGGYYVFLGVLLLQLRFAFL